MKILTIGAGVIGVTYAWQLQKAGYDLTHLVRKHKIDLYKTEGIQIRKESYLAMREGWEICTRQGIHPRKVTPTRYYYLPFFLLIPLTGWLYRQRGVREMFEGHVRHSPSEMKDMYFTLLVKGKQYGIKMPVYESYLPYIEATFSEQQSQVVM